MKIIILFLTIFAATVISCKKKGCVDPLASNYNSNAKKDNGSCKYDTISTISSSVEHVIYGSDERQHFDIYLPENHSSSTKTIIMLHGGAWVLGVNHTDSVKTFNGAVVDIVSGLLAEGYACAIMKYRLLAIQLFLLT